MDLNNAQQQRKILVVDDNPDIHRDFETILSKSETNAALDQLEAEIFGISAAPENPGHEYLLSFAGQGQQALEMVVAAVAADDPFHMAFVDMRMPPGWDGLETIQRIWAADPDLQIVLCTAYSDYSWEEIDRRLVQTENLLILKKPFDVSEVAQMASTLTRKWILLKTAQLRQEELEALVGLRTHELQETNKRLLKEIQDRQQLEKQLIRSQKMEAIGTLAAGVAHDLNNILSGIVSYPDLLLKRVDPQDPMHRQLQLIQKSGYKAAAIVQDMLTLGRRAVSTQDDVDLAAVVKDYLESPEWYKTRSYYTNIDIETRLEPDLSCLLGSELQLSKALMNLVSNAAEAMPRGGAITIGLERKILQHPHEGYETVPPGTYIVLSVADRGNGIGEEDLEHIFEPFYTKKKMGRSGTGLGLAVVWGAVRDHNGFIDVSSRKERGTQFTFYFPDTGRKRSTVSQRTDTHHSSAACTNTHVLVVDDVLEQREITVEMLTALGYSAEAVPSGEAALEYLKNTPADLLILDMVMDPGIDGLETYQRALAINPTQKVIIASGFTKTERVKEALSLGASGFLHKPYRLQVLAEAVGTALQK